MSALKLILAGLLLLCLFEMPYGYYNFVRYVASFSFAYFAINTTKNERAVWIALCILLQPFIKIPLGRTIWNIVDVILAVGLIMHAFKNNTQETDSSVH